MKEQREPAAVPVSSSSEEEEDSTSEEEEDSSSDAVEETREPTTQFKKAAETATQANAKATTSRSMKSKRPSEGDGNAEAKKSKKLWSEAEEISLLNGLLDYSCIKKENAAALSFFDYVKKSLQVDVSKSQVDDKIRRLKKKYQNNLGRGRLNPTLSQPHEQRSFDLSKELWGSSAKSSNRKALKSELNDDDDDGDKQKLVLFDKIKRLGVAADLEEFIVTDGLEIIGEKKGELEERWRKLKVAQLKLFINRNELINDQTKFILDAIN